jgi:hypothetical protein
MRVPLFMKAAFDHYLPGILAQLEQPNSMLERACLDTDLRWLPPSEGLLVYPYEYTESQGAAMESIIAGSQRFAADPLGRIPFKGKQDLLTRAVLLVSHNYDADSTGRTLTPVEESMRQEYLAARKEWLASVSGLTLAGTLKTRQKDYLNKHFPKVLAKPPTKAQLAAQRRNSISGRQQIVNDSFRAALRHARQAGSVESITADKVEEAQLTALMRLHTAGVVPYLVDPVYADGMTAVLAWLGGKPDRLTALAARVSTTKENT